MNSEQLDALALEVAEQLIEERGGSRMDDKCDLLQYTSDLVRLYRKALKEKMEPQLWVSTASGKTANFKFLPIAVPLYSLEDWK